MQRLLLRLILSVLTLAAPGISTAADGNAKAKALYSNTCIACHGANGKGAIPGVPDLGPRMTMTDDDLTNSILNGLQSKGSLMAMRWAATPRLPQPMRPRWWSICERSCL
jgi:mono/diheme cytochrome c family protein